MKTGVFMDESVKIETLSMESGVLVDRNRKHVRLSMKTGVFMDKYDKNSELSMKSGVFMDRRIETIQYAIYEQDFDQEYWNICRHSAAFCSSGLWIRTSGP